MPKTHVCFETGELRVGSLHVSVVRGLTRAIAPKGPCALHSGLPSDLRWAQLGVTDVGRGKGRILGCKLCLEVLGARRGSAAAETLQRQENSSRRGRRSCRAQRSLSRRDVYPP